MINKRLNEIEDFKPSSNRSFGIVMAAAWVAVALYPLVSGNTPHWWLLAIGAMFLLLALARPVVLAPLNYVWTRFGLLLGRIINPIVLGLMYFIIISPIAIGMKLVGRDPLKRKYEPEKDTYWQDKDPSGPTPETMRNQF